MSIERVEHALSQTASRIEEYLSHFSLLFLHGSQFIALRARFVGGLPSLLLSGGGEERVRTTPTVVCDRCCLERAVAGEVGIVADDEEELSSPVIATEDEEGETMKSTIHQLNI